MRYIIVAHSMKGIIDTLDIENYNKKANIPAPVVKDKCVRDGMQQTGCIFYDGEYSWTGVKTIEIYKILYFEQKQPEKKKIVKKINNNKSKFIITKTYYWDYRLHRYVRLNVIRQR